MSKLHVGFHKADITPQTGGIPLAGWGATHLRLAATVAKMATDAGWQVGNVDATVLAQAPKLASMPIWTWLSSRQDAWSKQTW